MTSFKRDVLKLASSTGISQLLIIAATPALSRLYGPESFGRLAVFASLYSILVGLFTLKFELSILLPKPVQKAKDLTRLTLRLSAWFSTALLVGMITANLTAFADFAPIYFLLPLAIFTGALLSTAQQWGSRLKHFGYSSVSSVANTLTNVSICFALFYAGFDQEGLIVGYVAGLIAAALYLCLKHSSIFADALSADQFQTRALIKEYNQFPAHILPNAIVAALAQFSLPIIVSYYFSTATVGQYSMANRALLLPATLLGGAIADTFRSEFVSRLHRGDDHVALLKKMLVTLITIAVPAFVAIYLLSPMAFELFLGHQFAEAGSYAQYLCAGAAAQFITLPFLYLFIALGKTRAGLLIQTSLNVVQLAGFVFGAHFVSIEAALIAFSILCVASCVVLIAFVSFFAISYRETRQVQLTIRNELIN